MHVCMLLPTNHEERGRLGREGAKHVGCCHSLAGFTAVCTVFPNQPSTLQAPTLLPTCRCLRQP